MRKKVKEEFLKVATEYLKRNGEATISELTNYYNRVQKPRKKVSNREGAGYLKQLDSIVTIRGGRMAIYRLKAEAEAQLKLKIPQNKK